MNRYYPNVVTNGLCLFMITVFTFSCARTPEVDESQLLTPYYNDGIRFGTNFKGQEDYEIVNYIHDQILNLSAKERQDFQQGFVEGYVQTYSSQKLDASRIISLALQAANSPEYRNGLNVGRNLREGKISTTMARSTLIAPRAIADQLAIKSAFIKGFENSNESKKKRGEAMYYNLIR